MITLQFHTLYLIMVVMVFFCMVVLYPLFHVFTSVELKQDSLDSVVSVKELIVAATPYIIIVSEFRRPVIKKLCANVQRMTGK